MGKLYPPTRIFWHPKYAAAIMSKGFSDFVFLNISDWTPFEKRNIISGDVNYYGFSKGFGFGHGRGGILKTIFEWEGSVKPVSSIFMGLSPELEFALYTLGVLLKPDDSCTVSLGGKTIDIRTHVFKNGGKKYLGTAFPDIWTQKVYYSLIIVVFCT